MEDDERDPVDVTLATYQGTVDAYVAAGGPPAPTMASFLDRLAQEVPGGSVLEVGSGPGWDADHLEERGLHVTRTDATPAFVERLRRLGHEAHVLDVRRDDLGGPYDALYANAVLLHLSPEQFEVFLRRARPAAGLLAVTLKEGDGQAWTEDKLGAPRRFTYWRADPLRELVERSGWRVANLAHVQGSTEPWLHLLAR